MSQENVEIVQRAVEAWNADDLDAFLAELEPTSSGTLRSSRALRERQLPTEVMTAREGFGGGTIAGDARERLTYRPQEFRDLGESVLALGHIDLTARVTGIEFRQEVGEVCDLRAGKIVRIRNFLTHAEAIEAAGLRE